MEHITVKDLGNGKIKLTPDEGYLLKDTRTDKLHSEVVIKKDFMKFFVAVEG